MNCTPKRGQTEVLGLLAIVILLIFIGMIYLRFALQPEDNSQSIVRENIGGSHLLSALLHFDVGEGSMKKRFLDCFYDTGSCNDLKIDLEFILGSVLKPGENYLLTVLSEDETIFFSLGICERGIVTTYHFIEEGALFEARMTLCKSVA